MFKYLWLFILGFVIGMWVMFVIFDIINIKKPKMLEFLEFLHYVVRELNEWTVIFFIALLVFLFGMSLGTYMKYYGGLQK